jgi:hypothetical protein
MAKEDNRRIGQRPLEEVIGDNQGLLGKPIGNKSLFDQPGWDSLPEDTRYLIMAHIGMFLFSPGYDEFTRNMVVQGEEAIRKMFGVFKKGLPQFAVTYHSPSCIRDIFLTLKHLKGYVYCFSTYPLNEDETSIKND